MRRPGENDLWPTHEPLRWRGEAFRNCDDIGKALQRMQCCTFQAYHRDAGIFLELFYIEFAVIIFSVLKRRKCSYCKNIKIFTQDGCSIFYMLYSASAHDSFFFKFERPALITYIKDDGFHAQVLSGHLCAEARAHAGVQE